MFIKSKDGKIIINLDRVLYISKYGNQIYFCYSMVEGGSDYWKYDSIEERDEEFEKIQKLLNVVQFK